MPLPSRNRIVVFTAVICLIPCSAAVAQAPLRWRLAEGERFRVVASQAASTAAEIGGRTFESSLNVGVELDWRVRRLDEKGAAEIEQTLSRLTVMARLPGAAAIRYDSASQEANLAPGAKAIAEEFRPLIGKAARVRLSPRGELEEAAADHAAGDEVDAAFTVAEVRRLLGRLLPPLPPDDDAPGEAWRRQQQAKTPHGAVRIEGRYRLRPPGERDQPRPAIIDAAYTYQADPQKRGVMLTIDEQENTGIFSFDPQLGRLVRGEIRQSLTMQVAIEGAEVEQRVSSTMRIAISPAE